jgi:hypothetical protein
MYVRLQSIDRVCDCPRRYDFSGMPSWSTTELVFSLSFLGVSVAAVSTISDQKKNADAYNVADKYEEKYFCNYFAILP